MDKPSVHRRFFREAGSVLAEIVQRDGDRILMELLRARTAAQRPPRLPLTRALSGRVRGAYRDLRARGLGAASRGGLVALNQVTRHQLGRARLLPQTFRSRLTEARERISALTGFQARAQYALLATLSSATYLSGVCLGFNAPALDLKISRKGNRESSITLHSAPLFSLEITLEFLNEILERARLHPQLSPRDQRSMIQVETLMRQLHRGVSAGAAARERTGSRPPDAPVDESETVSVTLDDQAYALAGSLFTMLSEMSEKK